MEQINNTQNQFDAQHQQDELVQIKDLIYLCLRRWYWFAISVALCLIAAMFYLLRTPSVYTRSAEVQIKTDSRGRTSSDIAQFSELGLFSTNTNVYNEIKAFASHSNMYEVVKRLHLDMNYTTSGRFHDNTLYGRSLPVSVEFIDDGDGKAVLMDLDLNTDGSYKLSSFVHADDNLNGKTATGAFADTVATPVGRIVVTPTTEYESKAYPTIHIRKTSVLSAANRYKGALSVSLSDKMSQVILLTVSDISTQRAEDILNTLISVYNENWVADKNQVAVSTSMFINDRLNLIESELSNVDSDISTYKSANLVPDVQAASNLYMTQSNEISQQIVDKNNQLYMTSYVRDYLTSSANKNQLLPANSGISNAHIESQIAEYNSTLLQRNNLVSSSSENNPLVLDLDKSLESLRGAIVTSVDNQILALNNQVNSLQKSERQATARIAANPTQAKYLLSVERQQTVKEALYLFLLQKREENELSQAFTAYNTRIIDPPHGSSAPTSPKSSMIYLIALIMGLAIPFGIIYITEVLNGKVRGRDDIKKLTMPFLGEIPLTAINGISPKKLLKAVKKGANKKKASTPAVAPSFVVKSGSRDVINEAFRVLRTNVEFMAKEGSTTVFCVTSFNPGSGKSFISGNLAKVLSIKGKSVLGIDCDLRHGSLSNYVDRPKTGLATYLSGKTDDLDSLVIKMNDQENLSILPTGNFPPNPSELVSDPRFQKAIDHFIGKYDYILLDCPPIDVVADTQIISKSAERTLFVLRAGLCEKALLPELESFYQKGRFNNLSIILNGTEVAGGGYFGQKYGYRYAYNYGHYGYSSYTNGKDDDEK